MAKADSVVAWLLGEGRQTDHDMNGFGSALINTIVAAGIPVARAFCGVRTLHPLVAATGYIWRPGAGRSDTPGGFDDTDIEALQRVGDILSLVIESELRDRIARQVLDTYVGRRTGELVLSGGIRRGFGETIEAVVWFSDLSGFTALTERLPRDDLLEHLNTHFEIMVDAIDTFQGEVLKFLGDGLLAIFEVSPTRSAARCCVDAMAAMHAARQATKHARGTCRNPSDLNWSLALHIGEVSYGNVGAPDRLDFTVIGPTVNQAARLEALSGTLGEPVVMSKAFAETYGQPLRDLGTHPLKGVREQQQVFAPKP